MNSSSQEQETTSKTSFIKEESHKLYLAARNIAIVVPGLVAFIAGSFLEGVPGETSSGPHINEYPKNKSEKDPSLFDSAKQVGIFLLAAISHPKELNQAVKDFLKPEE